MTGRWLDKLSMWKATMKAHVTVVPEGPGVCSLATGGERWSASVATAVVMSVDRASMRMYSRCSTSLVLPCTSPLQSQGQQTPETKQNWTWYKATAQSIATMRDSRQAHAARSSLNASSIKLITQQRSVFHSIMSSVIRHIATHLNQQTSKSQMS